MNAFTIKDLENFSGIKAHTLRIWEQRYNFIKPGRTHTNIRYYSSDDLKKVLNIALLNKYGFKVSQIDRMLPDQIHETILELDDEEAIRERLINNLVKEMIDLDMPRFEKIIVGQIAEKGIEQTLLQIIFPFLERIGLLWETGQIHPAQEHLVVNIIRQKLIVAIETTVSPIRGGKRFLLFLPEGEHQELGLLFMYYILKSQGADAIYLGANAPLKDVEYIVKLKKPDVALIHLTCSHCRFNLEKFIQSVEPRFTKILTIISGEPAEHFRKKLPPRIQLKKSLSEVVDYLRSLQ